MHIPIFPGKVNQITINHLPHIVWGLWDPGLYQLAIQLFYTESGEFSVINTNRAAGIKHFSFPFRLGLCSSQWNTQRERYTYALMLKIFLVQSNAAKRGSSYKKSLFYCEAGVV